MPLDWQALSPHRSLAVEDTGPDGLYVERPDGGADLLARRLAVGLGRPLAVAGPPGCGKSTVLAAAARRLQDTSVTILLQVDRLVALDEDDVNRIVEMLAIRSAWFASFVLRLNLSNDIANLVKPIGPGWSRSKAGSGSRPAARGLDLFRLVLRDIKKRSNQSRLVLLVDGLEKAPEAKARDVATVLLELREETDLVLVIPQQLYVGPGAELIARECHVHPVGPISVVDGDAGRNFLIQIAERRLGGTEAEIDPLRPMMIKAAFESGGVPRVFLQLVQDAAANALLEGRDAPTEEDLAAAAKDHAAGLLRLLREGDREVLSQADETSGAEIQLDRRIRYLGQGLLLPYRIGDRDIVRVAPLIRDKLRSAA